MYCYQSCLKLHCFYCVGVTSKDIANIGPLLKDIQERARFFMLLMNGENAEELGKLFKIKRNLMVVNKKNNLLALTNLTKALSENSGTTIF